MPLLLSCKPPLKPKTYVGGTDALTSTTPQAAPPAQLHIIPSSTLHSSGTQPARLLEAKRQRTGGIIPDDLGTLISRDLVVLHQCGWEALVTSRQARGDLSNLDNLRHPARRLLRQYKYRGAPVVLQTRPWTQGRLQAALARGSHSSAEDHLEFLRDEFTDMVNQAQWIVLPYSAVRHLPGLRLSPLGVVPQHERRPRTIVDYTFSGVNPDTVPIAPLDAMQFGNTLPRLIRHLVLADPRQGPPKLIKVDIADGFYRIGLKPTDVPKLGVVYPGFPGEPPLVAFPITLPMGWTNSPPLFCSATETIADIANANILKWRNPAPHRLDETASSSPLPEVSALPAHPCSGYRIMSSDGAAHGRPSAAPVVSEQVVDAILPPHPTALLPPPLPFPDYRDPYLAAPRRRPLATVDVFVDDFIAAAQGSDARLTRVRRILFDAIDQIFRPLDNADSPYRKEPASVKKLKQGDADWGTCKTILGWILDTQSMTLSLPPRRMTRLAKILASIPLTQKRTTINRWHQILGELRSMSLAIPGSRGLFSHMQEALRHREGHPHRGKPRLSLHAGVHDALQHFRLLHHDLTRRPTRLYELVPLPPTVIGAHDASGRGMGGVLLPGPTAISRSWDNHEPSGSHPVIWRATFPPDITASLVSWENPAGAITNSDLELAASLVHHEAAAQCFDLRERTILSKTDNTPTLFWQRKGSTTTTGPPAYLLCAQALHQRHHRYVPRHDYIPGVENNMSDDASRLHHLSDAALLTHFESHYPQPSSWKLWTPSPAMLSSVTMALRRQPCEPALLLHEPAVAIATGTAGAPFVTNWPSIPYCLTSRTPSLSSKSLHNAIAPAPSLSNANLSAPVQWRMPYGALRKRSRVWVNPTRGSLRKAK